MESENKSRRGVLRGFAQALLAVPVVGAAWQLTKETAYASLKLVDPKTNAMARALKYVHDPLKEKPDPRADKMGVPAAEQFCDNCQLYKKTGEEGGAEVGTCTMIPGVTVKGKGYCNSWIKAPGYVVKGGESKKAPEKTKEAPKKK